MPYVPDPSSSDSTAVGSGSVVFTPTLGKYEVWRFISTVDCYIAQGSAPAAAAADGNLFWPAKVPIDLGGIAGTKVAVIQASVAGTASLTRMLLVP